ncbi:MAG: hypothetical protein IJ662_10500 [Clostridia bacterium]|nr:hypothetical protein [Clostridia bacterium]
MRRNDDKDRKTGMLIGCFALVLSCCALIDGLWFFLKLPFFHNINIMI